jgi:hypothetical protein
MTHVSCAVWCDKKQYALAGVKDGRYCYCGTGLKFKHRKPYPAAHCITACSGCERQTSVCPRDKNCGGPRAFRYFPTAYKRFNLDFQVSGTKILTVSSSIPTTGHIRIRDQRASPLLAAITRRRGCRRCNIKFPLRAARAT